LNEIQFASGLGLQQRHRHNKRQRQKLAMKSKLILIGLGQDAQIRLYIRDCRDAVETAVLNMVEDSAFETGAQKIFAPGQTGRVIAGQKTVRKPAAIPEYAPTINAHLIVKTKVTFGQDLPVGLVLKIKTDCGALIRS
jgi:hypothetical protein